MKDAACFFLFAAWGGDRDLECRRENGNARNNERKKERGRSAVPSFLGSGTGLVIHVCGRVEIVDSFSICVFAFFFSLRVVLGVLVRDVGRSRRRGFSCRVFCLIPLGGCSEIVDVYLTAGVRVDWMWMWWWVYVNVCCVV